MANPTLPLTHLISQSSSRDREYRTLTAQYGDNYQQDAPDGTNDVIDTWSLNFENLSVTDREIMIDFLDTVKASSIWDWQAHGDKVVKQWKVVKGSVKESFPSGNTYTITFSAKQVA